MSEGKPNWVDRTAARDRALKQHASEFWQDARAAVQDCCESFKKHYCPNLECRLENGHRVRIMRPFPSPDLRLQPQSTERYVIVSFNSDVPCIDVTVDETSRQFAIDSDGTRLFITSTGHEITLDEFTREALESALTDSPVQVYIQYPPRPAREI